MILAALAKFAHLLRGEQRNELRRLLKVMFYWCKYLFINLTESQDQNEIVVSRLCCPACWGLLDIMDGLSIRFDVHGGHPTIYPVDLPSWLLSGVVEKAVARFEEILQQEITNMMIDKMEKKSHAHTPSGQSDLVWSTGSRKKVGYGIMYDSESD